MSELPIAWELVKKRAYLPEKLTELSYLNKDVALDFLRSWGEGTKPVSQIWDEVVELLSKHRRQEAAEL